MKLLVAAVVPAKAGIQGPASGWMLVPYLHEGRLRMNVTGKQEIHSSEHKRVRGVHVARSIALLP
ncbi:MAG: hypothetical protein ACK2U9_09300 [Anaerolineae bacterium]